MICQALSRHVRNTLSMYHENKFDDSFIFCGDLKTHCGLMLGLIKVLVQAQVSLTHGVGGKTCAVWVLCI